MLKNMVETKPKLPVHEQHFTPDELAEEWHISANTVRRLAEEFGGIIEIDRPEEMHKRRYKTIRIPESTVEKIYAKHFISISRAA
jgi:hypothetical protein